MDFIKLEDNKEIIDEKVFKNIDKNFLAHLSSLNYSRYGLIKEGLVGNLDNNRITFTKGKVTFPSGLSVEVKDSLSKEMPESKTTFLYLEKKVNELKILEVDSLLNKDPYKNELFNEDKADILVLGFVENSKFYFLNRQENMSSLPINGIGLYKGEFRDYVTLRGCRIATEFIDKYPRISKYAGESLENLKKEKDELEKEKERLEKEKEKFVLEEPEPKKELEKIGLSIINLIATENYDGLKSGFSTFEGNIKAKITDVSALNSIEEYMLELKKVLLNSNKTKARIKEIEEILANYKESGGSNSIKLDKKHIPTLTIKGSTDSNGKHSHGYYDGYKKEADWKSRSVRYNNNNSYWTGKSTKRTIGWSGDHFHSLDITHINSSQKPLSIEPDYTVFVPIIREY